MRIWGVALVTLAACSHAGSQRVMPLSDAEAARLPECTGADWARQPAGLGDAMMPNLELGLEGDTTIYAGELCVDQQRQPRCRRRGDDTLPLLDGVIASQLAPGSCASWIGSWRDGAIEPYVMQSRRAELRASETPPARVAAILGAEPGPEEADDLWQSDGPMADPPPAVVKAAATASRVSYSTTVRVCVDGEGVPVILELVTRTALPELDVHVIKELATWRYAWHGNGSPTPACTRAVIRFDLHDVSAGGPRPL